MDSKRKQWGLAKSAGERQNSVLGAFPARLDAFLALGEAPFIRRKHCWPAEPVLVPPGALLEAQKRCRTTMASTPPPKAHVHGFNMYVKAKSALKRGSLGSDVRPQDVMKALSLEWNGFADDDKEPYKRAAAEYEASDAKR